MSRGRIEHALLLPSFLPATNSSPDRARAFADPDPRDAGWEVPASAFESSFQQSEAAPRHSHALPQGIRVAGRRRRTAARSPRRPRHPSGRFKASSSPTLHPLRSPRLTLSHFVTTSLSQWSPRSFSLAPSPSLRSSLEVCVTYTECLVSVVLIMPFHQPSPSHTAPLCPPPLWWDGSAVSTAASLLRCPTRQRSVF